MTWQDTLFSRRSHGVRLGLEAIGAVLDALPGSRPAGRVVQIVGSNGKGSTAAMLAHGLRRHAARVGLYTSPHLHRVGERVRINGVAVEDQAIQAASEVILRAEPAAGRPLTFFEILTLAALHIFAEAACDIVVLEAGLGGRLDATSVVPADLTLITRISLDHQQYLGDTLEEIAAEKVAVMRRGVMCISTAAQPGAVLPVIEERARRVGAPLTWAAPTSRVPTGLRGGYQRQNAGLALCALSHLRGEHRGPHTTAEDPRELDGVEWPGRLEILSVAAGRVCLDVAHNLDGLRALIDALDMPVELVVFGCMVDKGPEAMLGLLRPWTTAQGAQLWLVPPRENGAMSAEALAGAGEPVYSRPGSAALHADLRAHLSLGRDVLVCGSHFLVAEVRAALLNISPGLQDDRDLSDPVSR